MQRHLQPAVDRCARIEDADRREKFRERLAAFVKTYAYLSQIVPYTDPELEMLYSFGRLLLPHLPTDRDDAAVTAGDEVTLQYYRLERVSSGPIAVGEGEA